MASGAFVYIDAENLKSSVLSCGYKTIDYPKLYNWLRITRNAKRAYVYAGYSDEVEKQQYLALEKHGYIVMLKKVMQYPSQVKIKKLKCPSCKETGNFKIKINGRRKANCDSELTLDVINDGVRKKYSEIIVFSADGDFGRMYEYVSEVMKKKVTIYAPMGAKTNFRTSTKIKKLGIKGIVRLNALEGILSEYAIK